MNDRSVDPQTVQRMLKFRTSILALDPYAKFFVDGNPLKVVHSKCGGRSMQKATNDTSNFREHVSICQGPHTSNGSNSSPKSSLQCGLAQSIHPTPIRPAQLPCPGFSFEEMFGRDYKSLPDHEREQVTYAAEVAGLLFNSKERSFVISKSCLGRSPTHQEPAQPCHNCLRVLELSKFKYTLCRKTSEPEIRRYSPFRSPGVKTIDAGQDQKAKNVSQSRVLLHPTFASNAPLGESLAPTDYCQPTWVTVGCAVMNIALVLCHLHQRTCTR